MAPRRQNDFLQPKAFYGVEVLKPNMVDTIGYPQNQPISTVDDRWTYNLPPNIEVPTLGKFRHVK